MSALNLSLVDAPSESAGMTSWLEVTSQLDPKFGGIANLLPSLCAASESNRHHFRIVGFCNRLEVAAAPYATLALPSGRTRWTFDLEMRHRFRELIRHADGVHIHGIWETHCLVASGLARACGRPYVISAHGMLERWALQHKRFRKALYATLVESRNLRLASCLHALTLNEAEDYRRIGLTNPIAVVPNGVDIPARVPADWLRKAYPMADGRRIALFLGRLHPKKGLYTLFRAWARVCRAFDDVHLVIAGPDFLHMRPALEQFADESGMRERVTFTGMLTGPAKWGALAASQVFVLPSYSEGFSIATLEALGMGVPVIVTNACNFPEIADKGCGWVTEPEEHALEQALSECFQLRHDQAERMSENGRNLIAARYNWETVGRQMREVYDWMLGGATPTTVEIR